jgi:hypothetical protein
MRLGTRRRGQVIPIDRFLQPTYGDNGVSAEQQRREDNLLARAANVKPLRAVADLQRSKDLELH